jgi:hypothetical protein
MVIEPFNSNHHECNDEHQVISALLPQQLAKRCLFRRNMNTKTSNVMATANTPSLKPIRRLASNGSPLFSLLCIARDSFRHAFTVPQGLKRRAPRLGFQNFSARSVLVSSAGRDTQRYFHHKKIARAAGTEKMRRKIGDSSLTEYPAVATPTYKLIAAPMSPNR